MYIAWVRNFILQFIVLGISLFRVYLPLFFTVDNDENNIDVGEDVTSI